MLGEVGESQLEREGVWGEAVGRGEEEFAESVGLVGEGGAVALLDDLGEGAAEVEVEPVEAEVGELGGDEADFVWGAGERLWGGEATLVFAKRREVMQVTGAEAFTLQPDERGCVVVDAAEGGAVRGCGGRLGG